MPYPGIVEKNFHKNGKFLFTKGKQYAIIRLYDLIHGVRTSPTAA